MHILAYVHLHGTESCGTASSLFAARQECELESALALRRQHGDNALPHHAVKDAEPER